MFVKSGDSGHTYVDVVMSCGWTQQSVFDCGWQVHECCQLFGEVGIQWRRLHECIEGRWSDVELAKKCGRVAKRRTKDIMSVCLCASDRKCEEARHDTRRLQMARCRSTAESDEPLGCRPGLWSALRLYCGATWRMGYRVADTWHVRTFLNEGESQTRIKRSELIGLGCLHRARTTP